MLSVANLTMRFGGLRRPWMTCRSRLGLAT